MGYIRFGASFGAVVLVFATTALPGLGRSATAQAQAPGVTPGTNRSVQRVEVLTLRQALALALEGNPALEAFSAEVRAREARALQAGLLPNPELGTEVENFGGSEARSGFKSAETTLSLSQLIEIGGKRGLRSTVASRDRSLAEWDYAAKRLDVLADTTQAFVEVLAGQRRLTLTESNLVLANRVFEAVAERVRAGRSAPLEQTKTSVTVSNAQLQLRRAQRELDTARKRLAANFGRDAVNFSRVEGDLDVLTEPKPISELTSELPGNPDLARWTTEIEQRRSALDLERAKRLPDLRLSGGLQRFEDTNDNAFVMGLSIPIPLFDRNQGGIAEAGHRLNRATAEAQAAAVRIQTEFSVAHQSMSTAYGEAVSLRDSIVPASRSAFEATQELYRNGRIGILDVLDSQRTLVEAQVRHLDALADYHKASADVDRLTAKLASAEPTRP